MSVMPLRRESVKPGNRFFLGEVPKEVKSKFHGGTADRPGEGHPAWEVVHFDEAKERVWVRHIRTSADKVVHLDELRNRYTC